MISQKNRRRKAKAKAYSLNELFRAVKVGLTRDLADDNMRRLHGEKERGFVHVINSGCPPYAFKRIKQISDFDKRIIWPEDKPFEVLAEQAYSDFIKSQTTFGLFRPLTQRAQLVLDEARDICHAILGEFDHAEFLRVSSFGKRAAVGLKRRESYLDTRFERLSGTEEQIQWFNEALSHDIHLLRAVRKRCRKRKRSGPVKLAPVPKSWKDARIVAPDTVLGGFISRALGVLFRDCLERNTPIDLAVQQQRHRIWAKRASVTGKDATIDMKKASDSFVKEHVEYMVPESWHYVLACARVPEVLVNGKLVNVSSYMLMGSGHTFPLQTILFYCLAEATRRLLKRGGAVSVYGDDIILPTRCAVPFITVMTELGFTVNEAKSFFDMPDPEWPSYTFFRESCGGDFKGGVDVRPYMPECNLQETDTVSRNEYVAWCHRIINGLLDHWDEDELSITLQSVIHRIKNSGCCLSFVPPWEVDHAGIKHSLDQWLWYDFSTVSHVMMWRGIPSYFKLVYVEKPRPRRGYDERPYLWDAYRKQANKPKADLYSNEKSGRESDKSKLGEYRWKSEPSNRWPDVARPF